MTFEIKHGNKKHLYDNHLNQINDIKFTYREVDILACMLHKRGQKKIASLLSLSPKTINTHIHNIALKIGQGSREFIIDFIEKSGKVKFIKEYYLYILAQASFDKKLINISKTVNTNKIKYHIFLAENLNSNDKSTLIQLKADLTLANLEFWEDSKECEHRLQVIKPNLVPSQANEVIFLILDLSEATDFNIKSNIEIVDLYTDYYLGVFLILQKLIHKKKVK